MIKPEVDDLGGLMLRELCVGIVRVQESVGLSGLPILETLDSESNILIEFGGIFFDNR